MRYQDLRENRQLVSFLVSVFLADKVRYFLVNAQFHHGILELKFGILFFFLHVLISFQNIRRKGQVLPPFHLHQKTATVFWLLHCRKTKIPFLLFLNFKICSWVNFKLKTIHLSKTTCNPTQQSICSFKRWCQNITWNDLFHRKGIKWN